jgi:hypothetical protein
MPTRDELDAELAALNAAVNDALRKRREWMDKHMTDYAKFQVGDELVDMRTGRVLGTVCELYRYWGGRDDRYDTSNTSTANTLLATISLTTPAASRGSGLERERTTPG